MSAFLIFFCFGHSSGYSKCLLDYEIFFLYIYICFESQRFCSKLPVGSVLFFSMKSEWSESCTESMPYTQVNSSIMKDQIGVLSVLVIRQPLGAI